MIRLKQILLEQNDTSNDDVYKKILSGIGSKVTEEKLKFMRAWRQAEDGQTPSVSHNNPFNTTQPMEGGENKSPINCLRDGEGVSPNPDGSCPDGFVRGVRSYKDINVGIQATIKTLTNGYYPNLLKKLQTDNITAAELADTADLKTWGTGSLIAKILQTNWSHSSSEKKPMRPVIDTSTKPAPASITLGYSELYDHLMKNKIKLKTLL